MERYRVKVEEVTRSHGELVPYLFPEARDARVLPALYAAFSAEAPQDLLGMALLSSPVGTEDPAFRVALHVMEAWRRRGIGAQLLAHVIEVADCLRAPALRNMQPARSDAAHKLMRRFGFHARRMTIGHEFLLDTALSIFGRQLDMLQSAGRIPCGIVATPYAEGTGRHPLSSLCKSAFGTLTHGHLEAMGEYPAPGKDYSFSRAFWLDGKLLGAWAAAVKDGVATFDPLLIAPEKRNTWVFTHVIHSVLQELARHGIRRGYAQIHQDNLKMMAVMCRVGAKAVDAATLYELALRRQDMARQGGV